ncbi:substrate-binding domain-containing protein [Primorskyibacter flagellatus]|uniref:Tungstate transport system substrate-binding protein n=1 Tax=Primorskyibacter flagellatus TaxID=1387277 RepID=A0A1W2CDX6_9RHOB|nr:substrate-binding domain-containing protein [Primorskyibacter flagellatus]SMC83072.1 tungstate transport system substrate-binding protein [Primorskyibacter flagellatus]
MLRTTIGATTLALILTGAAWAQDQSIIVQSTTSTANSGLYDYLLPIFQDKTGIQVNVVAVGTGQAIKNAENCDGDVLLVHAKASEEAFVEAGFGTERTDLMFNDFVIVGPDADPAGVGGMDDVQGALTQIAEKGALFASRGDDSGTHKKEVSLWSDSGVDPTAASGDWYRETGSGMGATLNAGIGMGAYVMTDRATWISFENKQDYAIQVQGDEDMFNQYGVIPVSPEKCPEVNVDDAQTFADWLLSGEGQDAIAAFKVADQQLFFPNAPEN